jgi:hypothetical protein
MTEDNRSATQTLNGVEDSRRAVLELLAAMRYSFFLYTPLVRPELYNDADVLAAIRERVVNQPRLRLQWLLPSARDWRGGCPGLIRLSERLTTAFNLHTPNRDELPDRPELAQAFAIVDERRLLHFSDPRRLIGIYKPLPTEGMKELLELFRELWHRSQPDPKLRRLGI